MRFIITILVLCSLALIGNSLYSIPSTFPYQAHSFNDLDIARHLMEKKVKYFKFDASLANLQSCSGYSTWKQQSACITLDEYAQDMCCIAMRGDASSQPNFYYPFNTSAEFVKLLDSFLAEYEKDIDILFVAIDFQFSFSFSNTLAQKFMYELAVVMNKYEKLHVSPKGDYVFEYDRVCRFGSQTSQNENIKSIENIGCTPERKLISNSRFFLQSGAMDNHDTRDYKGRIQNFNTIFRDIDRLCSSGFPTWPNKHPHFPLIFWQPSNEMQIQQSLRKLMSPECQKKHNRTLSGIVFASNIDPEMFQLAMKTTLTNGSFKQWNLNNNKYFMENVVDLKMTKVTVQKQERLVIYRKVSIDKSTRQFLSIVRLDSLQKLFLEKEVQTNSEVIELRGVGDRIIVVTLKQRGGKKQFQADLISYNSNLQALNSLQVPNFISSYSDGKQLFYMVLSQNQDVSINYHIDSMLKKPAQLGLPVPFEYNKIQTISSIFYSKEIQTQYFQLILGSQGNKTWIASVHDGNVEGEKILTFGTNPQVIGGQDNSVMIFLEDSYTHGGLLMNNNGQNTCVYHKVESLKPLATLPHLVNTIHASINSLLAFTQDFQSDQIVTACHPTLPLSKLFNGAKNGAVYIWNRTVITTQFIPITQQDFITSLFSGGSNFETSLRNKKGFLLFANGLGNQQLNTGPIVTQQ